MPMSEPVKRILLVEDDVHLTEILRVHLRADGYALEEAADGRRGMALVERGGWDAIILDLMLPGVDGLEICRREPIVESRACGGLKALPRTVSDSLRQTARPQKKPIPLTPTQSFPASLTHCRR